MHCDITTEFDVNSRTIVATIGNLVKSYAGRTFKYSDFSQIIHFTDTDGAFIPNEAIEEDSAAEKPIENRNKQKQENLNRLFTTHKVWNIPYRIFYMSCYLDHALYGMLNCTDEEKEKILLHLPYNFETTLKAL